MMIRFGGYRPWPRRAPRRRSVSQARRRRPRPATSIGSRGAEVVNLRAGPSDESNIRGRVEQGDEVIELTSEGNWRGVRVLDTGEEGWIYGGLLEAVAQSGLLPRRRRRRRSPAASCSCRRTSTA